MATDIQLHKQQAQELSNKLWAIANDLRGTMDASKFKDYILGIIFYRFLSEKTEKYMEEILKNDGMTYSEYAREGFFQLLAVSFFNLVLVLAVLNYFKRHPVLTGCLAVISLCTGILLGSSAFRMCLYVAAYGLTFLRLGVLWFLALLAVLFILIHDHMKKGEQS